MTFALVGCRGGRYAVSGQHESVLVCRTGGEVEVHETQGLGFYLGMLPDVSDRVRTLELRLSPGDIMVLYTDGITEAGNEGGEQYGVERAVQALRASRALGADRIRDRMMRDLYNFIGDEPLQDDVSLVVIKQR
jgi:serine phosphatase RsbU (regulator of sigma subunit)